ncbi:FtsW/RodA/SpoVE family cell cycle protein [Geosporobacter ferrireducens]|uniref:Cell division protein FtsW n=1 Tax=Geosporobacter ferrireducens TaxID=1424294 RepID=A0A1D8GDJ4_9FIRM|nr:FtsW/RodA/SpoVE family cell cycle protein [Geosporobacter ferrireducens]AOT68977.1 hypothetical protein Gferi_05050 [Geosporobacter ferrireducens]MTI54782.1 FtsW/RodA/SpoVE family cell cycle protein [Geosporobacter ferrireducens]
MKQSSKISEYLKAVCEQIRWKKAHEVISKEIEDHIIDQKNAFVVNGLDEETATERAIAEMGDPILVGSEFDRTHRPKIEWSIIILTGITLLMGLAIRIFISYDFDMQWILNKSIISIILGIGCMIIVYFLDFTTIGKYPRAFYFSILAITIGIMIVSPAVNGRYQHVEFILLLFPTAFAGIIYSMRSKGYLGIILSGGYVVVPIFIGRLIPSLSSAILYSVACLILITLAILKGWFYVNKLKAMLLVYIPTVIIAMTNIYIYISKPYRLNRLRHAFNPSLDPMGGGYLGAIIKDIIKGAKFFDQGELTYSNGVKAVLPQIHTNSLLTYLIHEFGWISFIIIMTVILTLIIRFLRLCSKQKSVLGKLVSTSVLITFTIQVVLYVVFNLGFPLYSPLTLPLISYDTTGTIINMILIGIMLSVFKSGYLVRDNTITMRRKNNLFEVNDGKIIINLKSK